MISASNPSSFRNPLLCAKGKVKVPAQVRKLILILSAAWAEVRRRKTVSKPTRSFSIGLSSLISLVKVLDETAFVQLFNEAHISKVLAFAVFVFFSSCLFSGLDRLVARHLTLAPAHLRTLFARASTSGGIVRPICFAAFRLMMNSNFVACCTGKSAGLAPFKILST